MTIPTPPRTTLLDIVEGWTGELGPFTLRADGVPVNLTGLTVELLIRPWNRQGRFSETDGDVRVVAGTGGQVYYAPDASDFSAAEGPYEMRWRVTDSDGFVVFFPNGEGDYIGVGWP